MSEQPGGPGWWIASDGRWYPPEKAPPGAPRRLTADQARALYEQGDRARDVMVALGPADAVLARQAPAGAMTPSATPICHRCGAPTRAGDEFCARCGDAATAPLVAVTGAQPGPYRPGGVPRTNGLAIASLVLGILWIYWIGSVLAVVFGHIALRQIRKADGWQGGRGMAIAGAILGWIGVAILAVLVVLLVSVSGETTAQSGTLDEGSESDSAQVVEEPPVDTEPKTEPPFELSSSAMRDDPVCQDALDRYLASPEGSIEEQDATDDLEVFCRAGALEDIPECERALESSYSADPAEAWAGYDEFIALGCPGSLAPPNVDRP